MSDYQLKQLCADINVIAGVRDYERAIAIEVQVRERLKEIIEPLTARAQAAEAQVKELEGLLDRAYARTLKFKHMVDVAIDELDHEMPRHQIKLLRENLIRQLAALKTPQDARGDGK